MSFLRKLKKKNVILIALFALLLGVSYVNFTYFNEKAPVSENIAPQNATLVNNTLTEEEVMSGNKNVTKDFFEQYRLQRDNVRSENIETLKEIAESEENNQSVESAQADMVALVKLSETELLVENQIKAKGYEDCVIFIHEGYVNVVVLAKELNSQQAVQIQDIVAKNTKTDLANITIAASGTQTEEQQN